MLGIQAFPALIYTILVFGVPESPRWILEYLNDKDRAVAILKEINPDANINEEITAIETEKSHETIAENIFMKNTESHFYWRFSLLFSTNFRASMPFCIMLLEFLNWLV